MNCAMCGTWMGLGTLIGVLVVVLLVIVIWRLLSQSRQ